MEVMNKVESHWLLDCYSQAIDIETLSSVLFGSHRASDGSIFIA